VGAIGPLVRGSDIEKLKKVLIYTEVAMTQPVVFSEILDAAEQLDADAQFELVAVLSRRLAERGRERVAATAAQARASSPPVSAKP
jgi:hypothetical protein